jgi:NADH-quinone oxidoreductase subunit C
MRTAEIFDLLGKQLGADAVSDLHADPVKDGDPWFVLTPGRIGDICRMCRDDARLACGFLECLTGVDYPNREQIAVVYHLYSYEHRHRIIGKAFLPRSDPRIASVADIWPVANWHERECYDLLGVVFEGHPDLRRILLPDDWEGHPLRKDYAEKPDYHGIPTTRADPLELLQVGKRKEGS